MASKRANGTGPVALTPNFTDPAWKLEPVMVSILDGRGAGWGYKYFRAPVDQVKEFGGKQVRFHTDTEVVRDYAESMKAGTPFPVITVDIDWHGVDYKHRWTAAKEAGFTHIVVLQIQRKVTPVEANLLALKCNMTHGLRQTHAEKREVAISTLASGKSPEYVADELHIPLTTVKRYATESAAKAEARDLGVEQQFSKLHASTVALIPSTMHRPVKKELIKLLADAKMPATKAKDVVAEVEAATTDTEAKRVIKALREKRVPRPGQSIKRVMSESEASGRILQRSGLFRDTLKDTAVTSALLQSNATNPKYLLVKEMLEALKDGLEPLFVHYGV